LDEALQMVKEFTEKRSEINRAFGKRGGNSLAILEKGIVPDVVTDQTSAHDVLYGYIPQVFVEEAKEFCAKQIKPNTKNARWIRWRGTSKQCSNSKTRRDRFRLRQQSAPARQRQRRRKRFRLSGFCSRLHSPAFCEGKGPFRWVALSGDRKTFTKPTKR
jgi:urocanate hydratase